MLLAFPTSHDQRQLDRPDSGAGEERASCQKHRPPQTTHARAEWLSGPPLPSREDSRDREGARRDSFRVPKGTGYWVTARRRTSPSDLKIKI